MDPTLMGPEPSGLPAGTEIIAGVVGGIVIGIGLMYVYMRRKNRAGQKNTLNRKSRFQDSESSMRLEDSDNGGDAQGGLCICPGNGILQAG